MDKIKVTFLIIASGESIYDDMKREIHRYFTAMKADGCPHEHYFLYGKDYDTAFKVEDADLVLPCTDSWKGGILAKTILACKRIHLTNFQYCVRTNLSSIFHIDNLIELMANLPREACYAGVTGVKHGRRFVSGSGMILSPDAVNILASFDDTEVRTIENDTVNDDVRIAEILGKQSITATFPPAYKRNIFDNGIIQRDITKYPSTIQFRFKSANRSNDVACMKCVVDQLLQNK